MQENTQKESHAEKQARAQVDSIYKMVAALECDYERLAELRDERDNYRNPDIGNLASDETHAICWAQENPEDAEELAELEKAAGDCEDEEQARQRIEEDPLSVEVRSDWINYGEELTPSEFRIVLCTGGPHVELVGDLDHNGEPFRVRVLYKDWNESGELFDFDHDAVLTYCRCFYFAQ